MSTPKSTVVDQSYRQVIAGGGHRVLTGVKQHERQLWGLLVFALLADVVLTYHGLRAGFTEGNPMMRMAIDAAGIFALLGVKLLVVGFGAVTRSLLDERGAVVPLGLALPWLVAAGINASLLL